MSENKIEKETNTNTPNDVGMRATPGGAAPKTVGIRSKGGMSNTTISSNVYILNGSTDNDLNELAANPLFQMYAEVGPELYEIISRTNPTLKAVIDLAKEICSQAVL